MPVIGNRQSCHLRGLLPLGLAALCLVLPGVSKADGTNGAWPVVSVQTARNATASGSRSGAFTIQRTGDTGQALLVNYRISGTATNGTDYQRLSGTVAISAGQSSATIGVMPIGNLAEGIDKNVTVTLVPQNQPFTVVALPDTQCYTREIYGGSREIFTAQTQWIAAHKDDSNIVFVLHEGDLTDQNIAPEWTNARTSMSLLDGVVPYALAVGNHDGLWTSRNDTALFNQYFPLSQFQNLPTFGGVFESNRMDNCYHLFSAGGMDWLVFSLEFGPRNEVLAWANQVATNYSNRRVIVLTHTHIYSDNTLHGSSTNQLWLPTRDYGRANDGTDVWEKFIRHHANMGFVFNGHVLNSGTGRLVGVGDYGNQVFQMLANYQMNAFGGAGFLRIVQFFPDQDKMSVKTYSPFLDSWLTDTNNQFEYTNLGVFTNAGPGYLLDTQYTSAGLIITNDNVDLTPPGVCGLSYMGVPPIIKVTFNEPVETVSAQTVTNYSIDNGIHLTSATLLSDGKTVALATDSNFTPNTLYTLTVNHVKDCSRTTNVMIMPIANTFTYSPILLSDGFTNSVLQGWTVVDKGTSDAPSKWLEGSGRLMQLSNIYGPNGGATDHRQGTFIYWNDPQALGWSNYTFSVTFNNTDDDGLGMLFCYQNPSNYYKVDLDSQKFFHKLFKMAGGVETTLAAESGAYVVASNYVLRVELTNSQITVLLNGATLFGGTITDNSLKAGTVALYSWGSTGVFFNNLKVTPLQRSPRVTISSPINGATITQPAPVSIAVDASDPDGSVGKVTLFQGTSILATLTNAPYVFQWTNLSTNSYTLTAQAIDVSGLIGVSSPVGFVVVPPPPKPTFIVQPVSQNVRSGSAAMFSAQAAGPQPIHYQWLCNGVPVNGATNTFLILNNVQPANAGTNTVLATNQWGSVVSQPAILSVDLTAPPAGNTNGPPSVYFSSVGIPDPGVPLISVNVTNVTVVRIDWSSNFLGWTPLLTLTNGGNTLYFADPNAASQPRRFYRAVAQP
jgi:hypothetical protein